MGRLRDLPRPRAADVFAAELAMIKNEPLRALTETVVDRLPDYFWHAPASVVGLHAHARDNEVGGLVSHVRRVCRMTRLVLEPYSVDALADEFVIAGLLHDGLKYGWTGDDLDGTDHAIFAAEWLARDHLFEDRPAVAEMVRTHLGRWGQAKPERPHEWAFHIADYMVSRGGGA